MYGDSLATLTYLTFGDTLCPPEAHARMEWYGSPQTPCLIVDGTDRVREENPDAYYTTFGGHIDLARAQPPRLRIGLEDSVRADTIRVRLVFEATDTISIQGASFFVAVFEDSLRAEDGLYYNQVVRQILPDQNGFPLVLKSGALDTTVTFVNRWPGAKLGIASFIQDMTSKEILQAAVKRKLQEASR